MKRILSLILLVFVNIASINAVTTFTSISGGVYTTPATWVQSGSPVDADGIPDADDNVIISPSHVVDISTASLSNDLTVNGTIRFITNVTFIIKGNYTLVGAEVGAGTLRFDSGIITVTGTTAPTVVYHFNANIAISASSVINKFGSTTRITNGATVTNLGNCTIGTVTTYALSRWINGAGSTLTLRSTGFFTNGSFDASAVPNTVILNYNGSVVPKTTSSYNNLSTISSLKNLSQNTVISGDLTIGTGATLIAGAFSITIAGNWINSGSFTQNTGTVIFNGTAPQSIGGTSNSNFYRLTINSTNTVTLNTTATVSNLLTMTSGTFNVGTYALTGGGEFTATGGDYQTAIVSTIVPGLTGTYSITGGTITLNGAGTQTIRGGNSYYNIVVSGSGTKSPNGNLDINGSLTISSTFDVTTNNYSISCAGDWINNGTYIQQSGTVTFDSLTTISGSSITSFRNITISGSLTGHPTNINVAGNWINNGTFTSNGGAVTFNGTNIISGSSINTFNDLYITGTLTVPAAANINLTGNWSNNGSFVHNNGTITFNGTTTVGGSVATAFNNVIINGTLTGHPTSMSVNANWVNNGTFNHNNGNVTYPGNTVITGTSITSYHHLSISGVLTGSTSQINIAGNFTNSGSYNSNSGLVVFNGSAPQSMSGTGTSIFESLTLSNASGLSVDNGNYEVQGVLTITDGNLTNIGGTFTLRSDATRYARIAPIASGCPTCGFSGNFVIQRYIATRNIGTWANLSSPVEYSTMQDWDDELFLEYPITGFDPFYNRPSGTNVLAYDEPSANYYEVSPSTPLTAGKGFEIGLTDDSTLQTFSGATINTIGTPNYGSFEIPLSYTDSNGPPYPTGYSGENLIGNPYASAISLADIVITNALTTVDIFDYTINNYKTLSGSDLIGPCQGFWAYAQDVAASFTITEDSKSTDVNTPIGRSSIASANSFLNLTLASADGSHEMAHTLKIASNDAASDGWDKNDHPFRKSPVKEAPSITAYTGKIPLSISTFNSRHETYIMPIKVEIGINGNYQISSTGLNSILANYPTVLLEDKQTNTFINLNNQSNYLFEGKTSDSKDRFALHFSKSSTYVPSSSVNPYSFDDQVDILQNERGNTIFFNLPDTKNTTISVMDVLGRNIIEDQAVEAKNQSITITLPVHFQGMYLIVIQSDEHKMVKKFIAR